jgi:LysM repeat protein
MENPRYNQDSEYDYDLYDDDYVGPEATNLGLPPGQLALIIGVNAVISLVISISVVLLAGRSAGPGEVALSVTDETTLATGGETTTTITPSTSTAPEAAAQTTPGLESTPIETVPYTVETGDTLSLIAAKFSVSVYDLMVVNGLSDQDFIQAGQNLIIPLSGVPSPTPTFTTVPLSTETPLPFDPPTPIPDEAAIPAEPAATVGPSPTPTNTPIPTLSPVPTLTPAPFEEIEVVVSEVIAPGDLAREAVVILNRGAGVSLKDWTLEGSSLGIFQFPDIFLFSGGSIRIHTAAGENTASDLYLSQGQPAWQPQTTVILTDNKGTEISRFTASGQ